MIFPDHLIMSEVESDFPPPRAPRKPRWFRFTRYYRKAS
jgi:hypothetical protein